MFELGGKEGGVKGKLDLGGEGRILDGCHGGRALAGGGRALFLAPSWLSDQIRALLRGAMRCDAMRRKWVQILVVRDVVV